MVTKTDWIFRGNTLLRDIEPQERKNALSQLGPRLPSVLNRDLEWAVKFIEDIDAEEAWKWFDLDRETFYARRCSIIAGRIDKIKKEVAKLRALGQPVPSEARHLQCEQAQIELLQANQNLGGRGNKLRANDTQFRNESPTSQKRLLRRLARHAPKILDRYEQGEFKSVRAAAIAAGIVKVPTSLELLQKTWNKATEAERAAFRATICNHP
jgi:hypothetical protein